VMEWATTIEWGGDVFNHLRQDTPPSVFLIAECR
jgi:hypothetical protein